MNIIGLSDPSSPHRPFRKNQPPAGGLINFVRFSFCKFPNILMSPHPFRIIRRCCSATKEKYTRSFVPMDRNGLNRSGGFKKDNTGIITASKMKKGRGIGSSDWGIMMIKCFDGLYTVFLLE